MYRSTTNPTFERTTNGDAPLSPFVVRSTFTSGRLPMLNGSYFSAVLLGGAIGGALDILFAISFAAYKIRSRPSAANRRKWLTGCIRIRGRRSRSGVGPCPKLWPVFLVGNCFLGVGVAGAISDPLPVCSRCGIRRGRLPCYAPRGTAPFRLSVSGYVRATCHHLGSAITRAVVWFPHRFGTAKGSNRCIVRGLTRRSTVPTGTDLPLGNCLWRQAG